MEIVASGHAGGLREEPTITSSTAQAIDLSDFENRWVEIWFDQAAFVSWATSATSPTVENAAPVEANVDGTAPTNVGKRVDAETYISRFIRRPNLFMIVKAQSTSITAVEVIPTSVKHPF